MAELEANLLTFMLSLSDITDVFSSRIYVDRKDASIPTVYPYAIIRTVTEAPGYAHDGDLPDNTLIQIDAYSDDKSEVNAGVTAIEDNLGGYHGSVGYLSVGSIFVTDVRGGFEPDAQHFRRSIDMQISQIGQGYPRFVWQKFTADSVTLSAGTSSDDVTDLQTAHDGNFYTIAEETGAPGQNLIVDFVSVTGFTWVNVIAQYEGADNHGIALQLYNWSTDAWDTFDAIETGYADITTVDGYILANHDFIVPSDTNYIGTGANDGDVRVRWYHTASGNASHDSHIDVVALYN